MKHLLSIILGLVCLGLVIYLFLSKQNNDAQHEKDAEAITSSSNLLSSCQMEAAASKERVVTISNWLETCQSTSLRFSNELIEVKSAFATAKEGLDRQITDLKRQITQQTTQS